VAPDPGDPTPPARPAGGSTIVDPTLPPAQVGQVPGVAGAPTSGDGWPGPAGSGRPPAWPGAPGSSPRWG
jgi:hypothetical protein